MHQSATRGGGRADRGATDTTDDGTADRANARRRADHGAGAGTNRAAVHGARAGITAASGQGESGKNSSQNLVRGAFPSEFPSGVSVAPRREVSSDSS